jgi:hypothetical protein
MTKSVKLDYVGPWHKAPQNCVSPRCKEHYPAWRRFFVSALGPRVIYLTPNTRSAGPLFTDEEKSAFLRFGG